MGYYIVTGGGTGGHVFPAIGISEELIRRGNQVLYIGSKRGMENSLVPKKGIPLLTFKTSGIKNKGLLTQIQSLFLLGWAVLKSLFLFIRCRPNAVIGVGGYVSAPACIAAYLLRIPLFLQEQNASVGIANRFLGRLSRRIFLGFESAKEFFPAKKCLVTGNPLREEFTRAHSTYYNADMEKILVMGGSQGARAINQVLVKLASELPSNLQILHQTGVSDCASTLEAYLASGFQGKVEVVPFIEDMIQAYETASLVICRSGALTVSELIAMRRPALFVPFPRKGQNDQTSNAAFLAHKGAARIVEQGPDFFTRFHKTFFEIFEPTQLQGMYQAFSQLQHSSALATICDEIEKP